MLMEVKVEKHRYINWNFVDVFAHFKLTNIHYIVQTIYIYIKIIRR